MIDDNAAVDIFLLQQFIECGTVTYYTLNMERRGTSCSSTVKSAELVIHKS